MRVPVVIFAQVPPPEHGQSRMVQRTLDALRADADRFEVHHVNARFSETLEDVGEGSLGKLLLTFKYLARALRLRTRLHDPLLVYVPGPAEWTPILRDWILLTALRLVYRRVVFHWHAIGQGEWAHGSGRLKLEGPHWLDRCARAISRRLLENPWGSIAVSESSRKDAHAVGSLHSLVVPNGIEDPCPDYGTAVEPARNAAQASLASAASPCFRILYLSHGTLEKGLLDAVDALRKLLETSDPQWRFAVTFAGGISEAIEIRFERDIMDLQRLAGERLTIHLAGYVSGDDKHRCYLDHDIFLAPSRWESFGLTVLEAMAYGMRIVAAASDGVQGVLPHGHPYLAPVASPVSLAEKLQACCADLRESRNPGEGHALRGRFLGYYQLKDFSSNLVAAFRELGGATCPGAVSPSPESNAGTQAAMDADGPAAAVCDRTEHADDQPAPGTEPASTVMDRRCNPDGDSLAPHSRGAPGGSALPARGSSHSSTIHEPQATISISVYLADQNPGHDRSFGISRMTQAVLEALMASGRVSLETISSRTSQQAPAGVHAAHVLPWGTRRKWTRLLTDHLHPLFHNGNEPADVYYFPKGYLPWWHHSCRPSVVTIHDTIIQYDEDRYPRWRKRGEYAYWAWMLKHTLRNADRILTVSESARRQIEAFIERHGIPRQQITVTYEPCQYEAIPQPDANGKDNCVIHLASREPHKRTAHLVRWWHEAEQQGRKLPMLHLVGNMPAEVEPLLAKSRSIVKRPFLDDDSLQAAYRSARALILPSEIEGFGLPALEAYYLGTPVCYVHGTSVEEVLSKATPKGGFSLADPQSLFAALEEVLAMDAEEVRQCGLKLRETYASEKVADRMLAVFGDVKN